MRDAGGALVNASMPVFAIGEGENNDEQPVFFMHALGRAWLLDDVLSVRLSHGQESLQGLQHLHQAAMGAELCDRLMLRTTTCVSQKGGQTTVRRVDVGRQLGSLGQPIKGSLLLNKPPVKQVEMLAPFDEECTCMEVDAGRQQLHGRLELAAVAAYTWQHPWQLCLCPHQPPAIHKR